MTPGLFAKLVKNFR